MEILGHGLDVVDPQRMERMLADHGEHFLQRCFTPAEQGYAAAARRRPEHLAGRWAVKEAVVKALGTGFTQGIGWLDIETIPNPAGMPVVYLHGRAAQVARTMGIRRWWVSISHVQSLAAASVIAVGA